MDRQDGKQREDNGGVLRQGWTWVKSDGRRFKLLLSTINHQYHWHHYNVLREDYISLPQQLHNYHQENYLNYNWSLLHVTMV